MDVVSSRIQMDLWWFSWIAFAIALPLHAFLRQRDPLIRWQEHGNVGTRAFGEVDLALIIGFFFVLKLGMFQLLRPTGESVVIEAATILLDMLIKIAVTSFFIYWLLLRKVNLLETFGLNRLSLSGNLIWGGVVGLLVVPLVMAVGYIAAQHLKQYLGELPAQPVVDAFVNSEDPFFKIITIVGVVVITPIYEELLYRGYLYGVIKRFSDRFFATLFSCLIFTLAHDGVITILPILTLAIFLVLAYELSGSLWVPIIIHMFFNLINVIGMLVTANG